jgi:hypothetical protein
MLNVGMCMFWASSSPCTLLSRKVVRGRGRAVSRPCRVVPHRSCFGLCCIYIFAADSYPIIFGNRKRYNRYEYGSDTIALCGCFEGSTLQKGIPTSPCKKGPIQHGKPPFGEGPCVDINTMYHSGILLLLWEMRRDVMSPLFFCVLCCINLRAFY